MRNGCVCPAFPGSERTYWFRTRRCKQLRSEFFHSDFTDQSAVRFPEADGDGIVGFRFINIGEELELSLVRLGDCNLEFLSRRGELASRYSRMFFHFADEHLALTLERIARRLLELVADALDSNELGVEVDTLELFGRRNGNIVHR